MLSEIKRQKLNNVRIFIILECYYGVRQISEWPWQLAPVTEWASDWCMGQEMNP